MRKRINFNVRMLGPGPTFNLLWMDEKDWLAADVEADVADGLLVGKMS